MPYTTSALPNHAIAGAGVAAVDAAAWVRAVLVGKPIQQIVLAT